MLAFQPGHATGSTPASSPTRAPAASTATLPPRGAVAAPRSVSTPVAASTAPVPVEQKKPAAAAPVTGGLPSWESLIEQADLHGPFGVLAQNAVLRGRDGHTLVLAVQPAQLGMAVEPMVGQMAERIGKVLGEPIRLRFVSIEADVAASTPAARAQRAHDAAQAAAEQAIEDDPFVQTMKRDFGARVVPKSVKPLGS
jgi:DNA polymerase-3 subunit gamma/tau